MAIEIKMPQLGLTMIEGLITQWYKKEGDTVAKGEPLFGVETDKLTNEVESMDDGVLLKIVATPGEYIPVQGLLGYLGEAGEAIPEGASDAPATKAEPVAEVVAEAPVVVTETITSTGGRVIASPLAKKIAKDKGIDLSVLRGSGPNGRIVQHDVLNAPAATVAVGAPAMGEQPGTRREKMSPMRRAIAKNMLHSYTTAPTVVYNLQADTTEFTNIKNTLSQDGKKITYTDLLAKILSIALMEFPLMNSSIDGEEIIFHDYVNLGVAVGLEEGLIVPVVKNVHHKGIGTISDEIRDLAEKARYNDLGADDLSGGTFTITNLGMFGMESFTPIINQPESGILGINTIKQTPVEHNGEIALRPMMNLSLTADHRVVDGTVAAGFLKRVCTLIENPWQMLL